MVLFILKKIKIISKIMNCNLMFNCVKKKYKFICICIIINFLKFWLFFLGWRINIKKVLYIDIEGWLVGYSFFCDVWFVKVGIWYGIGKVFCWGFLCCLWVDMWFSGKWCGFWIDYFLSFWLGILLGYLGVVLIIWMGFENIKGN